MCILHRRCSSRATPDLLLYAEMLLKRTRYCLFHRRTTRRQQHHQSSEYDQAPSEIQYLPRRKQFDLVPKPRSLAAQLTATFLHVERDDHLPDLVPCGIETVRLPSLSPQVRELRLDPVSPCVARIHRTRRYREIFFPFVFTPPQTAPESFRSSPKEFLHFDDRRLSTHDYDGL